jgi:hypothetical protein
MPRLCVLTSVLCALQSAYFVLAHSIHSEGLPPIRIFGGTAAIHNLRSRNDAIESVSSVQQTKRSWADSDVNHHKKCGLGIGDCNPGDW